MDSNNKNNDNNTNDSVGHGRKRRERRARYKERRMSYVPRKTILTREAGAEDPEDRVTMRHLSRMYAPSADQTDILDPQTRITLEWKDLRLEIGEKRSFMDWVKGKESRQDIILDGISGKVGPGEIYAIMGPVGSGKTSLLKTLAGKCCEGKVYGSILINGQKRDARWHKVIAFIESQSSVLNPVLTVRESLDFVAKLCLPTRYGKAEKEARVSHIMGLMGLAALGENRIGSFGTDHPGISGGERKRLSIALELLREPKLIFLDEPTSGLDATSARNLVTFLRRLATVESLTIVMTVHQPRVSILSKFTQFTIIREGASLFTGDVDEALEYFEHLGFKCGPDDNPASYFLDCIMGRIERSGGGLLTLAEWKEAWRESRMAYQDISSSRNIPIVATVQKQLSGQPDNRLKDTDHYANWFTEVKWLFLRQHQVTFRSVNYFLVAFGITLIVGLYSGFIWFQMSKTEFSGVQDRIGLLYFTPRTAMIQSVWSVLENKDRIRFERSASMYRCSTVFTASLLFFLPTALAVGLVHLILVYYLSALRYTPFTAFLIFVGFNYLHTIGYLALGIIGGSLTNSYETGMIIATLGITIARLFSGSIANLRNMTPILSWLRFLSPAFYVIQGITQNEFNGQVIAGEPGSFWLQKYAMNMISTVWAAGGMLIYCAGVLIIAYVLFHQATRPQFNIVTHDHK